MRIEIKLESVKLVLPHFWVVFKTYDETSLSTSKCYKSANAQIHGSVIVNQ